MAGLFAELKRRNVIRMAGLYLVVTWLVVQVTGKDPRYLRLLNQAGFDDEGKLR